MDTIKKFYEALSSDNAMRERAEAMNEKHKGALLDQAVVAAEIVAFAKGEGYDFTVEELTAYASEAAQDISDDELRVVSGGANDRTGCFCARLGSAFIERGDAPSRA